MVYVILMNTHTSFGKIRFHFSIQADKGLHL